MAQSITREAALPKLITAAHGEYPSIVERLGLANCSNMPDDIAMLVLSRNLACVMVKFSVRNTTKHLF